MTSKEYFKKLRLIYFVFLTSIIPILGIATFYNDLLMLELDGSTALILSIVLVLIGSSTVVIGFLIFKVITSKITKESSIGQKLAAYQHAFLIRSALIEGIALLSAATYAITSFEIALIISALLFAVLFVLKPSPKKLKKVFDFSPTEIARIDSGTDQIVTKKDLSGKLTA
ncbi:MAG: hypothetical protein JJ971_13580 [Balneolaceae bacterium]|nr:hypothetical protein [Balneolaceae bacterium]MBO6547113.1 hypothetical protein [Balneolaceae bacterium]MBO6647940.1 hypothetical protein [Balneolaceae bacterium]